MPDSTYNGYTNYETWNVDLWASNEEPIYHYIQVNKPYNAAKAERVALEIFPNGTPDLSSSEAFDDVNWTEIAESWNEY